MSLTHAGNIKIISDDGEELYEPVPLKQAGDFCIVHDGLLTAYTMTQKPKGNYSWNSNGYYYPTGNRFFLSNDNDELYMADVGDSYFLDSNSSAIRFGPFVINTENNSITKLSGSAYYYNEDDELTFEPRYMYSSSYSFPFKNSFVMCDNKPYFFLNNYSSSFYLLDYIPNANIYFYAMPIGTLDEKNNMKFLTNKASKGYKSGSTAKLMTYDNRLFLVGYNTEVAFSFTTANPSVISTQPIQILEYNFSTEEYDELLKMPVWNTSGGNDNDTLYFYPSVSADSFSCFQKDNCIYMYHGSNSYVGIYQVAIESYPYIEIHYVFSYRYNIATGTLEAWEESTSSSWSSINNLYGGVNVGTSTYKVFANGTDPLIKSYDFSTKELLP